MKNNSISKLAQERERERESSRFSKQQRTANEVRQILLEKKNNKIIEEQDYVFLIDILDKCPQHAMNIYTWATLSNKKGLLFQPILEKSTNTIKYLSKNGYLSFDQKGIRHKLIIGDNYDALNNLLITHREKIDIIYIDPPYGCNDMGEFAEVNYENNVSRDNLLSMLKPRLLLAKQLLSENGVIFCSIDDKNQAYVKCLFDEIFGEKNFVANLCRNTSKSHSGTGNVIISQVDYVLMYMKNFVNKDEVILTKNKAYDFPYEDKNGKYKLSSLLRQGNHSTNIERPNCYYPIYVSKNLKDISLSKQNGYYEVFPPKINNIASGRWGWSKDWNVKEFDINYNFNKELKLLKTNINLIVPIKNNSGQVEIYRKHYEWDSTNNKKTYSSSAYGNIIEDCLNSKGTLQLKSIFNEKIFDYPKPIELLNNLFTLISNDSKVILDFFAGSGTTGHSVLKWNTENEAKKQFILVQIDDDLEKTKEKCNPESRETIMKAIELCKQQNLKAEISSLTYERLKRIMTGKASNGKSDFAWIKNNKPLGDSLDVYDIKTIANNDQSVFKTINPSDYDLNFNNIDKRDWICENFEITCKELEK